MSAKLKTLLAIVGPGLIVMVGDNDAGAFSTYGQAGQTYGTKLLWTFLLLIPVLYVNQEMVLRLGAVTGVGYAKLILERFGRFWGAFSVIDLFILNALTIVTEFIGIALAASYLGVPKIVAVILASLVIVLAASTGSLRRFERMAMALCVGSLLLDAGLRARRTRPIGQMASGFAIPTLPGGAGQLGDGHAAGDRDRRHYRRALAAVLPAVLHHRQADHPPLHALREGRPVARHRDRRDRRRRADGGDRGRVRRVPARAVHRRRRAGGRPVRVRRARGRRAVRGCPAGRLDDRRVRGVAVYRLRGRRHARR